MRHPILTTLAVASALGLAALAGRRALSDRSARELEADLWRSDPPARTFSEDDLRGLPEPAQRYLRHAVALGTPLAAACRLEMAGTMRPSPGAPPTDLAATEVLAPRTGFVWTARAHVKGLPVRVRDHYHGGEGGVAVTALGVVPVPLGGEAADVARSSRGRLVGEAVWCPTALVHPDVRWETAGDHAARYTIPVDGDPVSVTLHVAETGALREVTLDRWGNPDGEPARLHPYGFRVGAEGTFGGVTIPTEITGGWGFGAPGYDPSGASSFVVHHVDVASAEPPR